MKRSVVYFTAIFIGAAISGVAQAEAPPSGVFLAVPGSLAGAPFAEPSFLFGNDPRSAAWNPAAPSDRELPAFGAAAALAFPSSSGAGSGGYAALSASIPTTIGTAWAVLDGVVSAPDLDSWAAPTGTSLIGGLSKRVSQRLAVGIGLGAAIADTGGRDWSVSVSLGAELSLPEFGPAGSDLSLALLAAGPTLGGGNDTLPVISATPLVALRTRIVETDRFSMSASALIAAPGLSDLASAVGTSFALGPLSLDLGWHWSVASALEWARTDTADQRFRAFPSLTLRFDGSSFLRLAGYGTTLAASARPVGDGAAVAEASAVFSRGERDNTGPLVVISPGNRTSYSPKIVDRIVFPFSVRDASRLVEWHATVYGPDGKPVYELGDGSAVVPDEGLAKRIISKKKSVKIPAALDFPVAKAPMDGEYRIRASARDEVGNEGKAAELSFFVDRTPPSATARIESSPIFSPNGDGVRDFLNIVQEGSAEGRWTGTFKSSEGKSVRVFVWTDGSPASFSWDGRSDTGELVADGEYSYELEAVDDAGNSGGARIAGCRIDTQATPLSLGLDAKAMSSDNDAAVTSILLSIDAPRKRGLLSWNLAVIGEGGKPFRTWNGSVDRLDVAPTSIRFDGRSREGEPIPDGRYRFKADFEYVNGNRPSAVSPSFVVDSKRPSGRVRSSSASFSIDAGSYLSLYHDLSPGADWRGLIMDEKDEVVRVLPLGQSVETVAEWNGLNAAGVPVEAGRYRYVAEGTNGVGLVGRTPPATFTVETGARSASLVADRSRFSAIAGEGRLRLLPRIAKRDRIVSYAIEISNAGSAQVVRRYEGIAAIPAAISWNGRDEFGTLVADGDYVAKLTVLFEGGERVEAISSRVALDSTSPRATLALSTTVFSPNKDGSLDHIEIAQNSTDREAQWTGTILDDRGATVRSFSWKGLPPERLIWNGLDEDGALFGDGNYRYRLSSIDAAGNTFTAETPVFRLDSRVPTATVAVDKVAFSPNGDGFADSMLVRLVPSFSDGLDSWSVDIVDVAGKKIRTIASAGPAAAARSIPPSELKWDGSVEGGVVGDGTYRAVAQLRYTKGDRIQVESSPFQVDTTPPSVSASFQPLPFSPDGDGVADELFVDIRAQDASPIAGWILSIVDPAGYPFTTFSGKTLPTEPFPWDGRNLEGELVEAAQDYTYELIIRDTLGNSRKVSGVIPVDVFVLRDGDRLKIRISSIEFAPSSASLSVGDAKVTAKNMAVLDRIATVLARYPDYRIRVEGHAVNVSLTEREERSELAPLSLSRAQTVLEALVSRGVDRARLEAKGLGGREPIVPHGDVGGRWRNRRVEFILMR